MTTTADSTPPVGTGPAPHFALAVLALALGGFAIGTAEFVTMGLLREIATGVDASIPATGHVISAYAVGVVVGAPVLAVYGAKLPRRGLLVGLMAAYALFNAASALAPGYRTLLLARFLDGLPHGAYFGVASLVAARMAAPGRKGRAVALVMLGLSVANVIGVPAATWLGQHLGWRSAFWAVAVLAVLTVAMVLMFVPSVPGDRDATGRRELAAFAKPQVWLTLVAGAVGFGGMFAVYTYIAPIITEVGGLGDSAVPVFLLVFGLGMVAGTWVAGELADWSIFRSLLGSSLGHGRGAARLLGAVPDRVGCPARRLPDHHDRVGAGGQPAAAADGGRGRRPDAGRRDEPRLAQRRQCSRRLARRAGHRRRLRAAVHRPGRGGAVDRRVRRAGGLRGRASAGRPSRARRRRRLPARRRHRGSSRGSR